MNRRREIALVAGVVIAAVVLTAAAGAWYWRAQASRLDDMRNAVTSFSPPDEWVGWTQVGVTSRDYSPFCIDVSCPSHSERYVAAAPAGDVGTVLKAAIDDMGIGPVDAPDRQCIAGERCLYSIDADGFTVSVVLSAPLDSEQGQVADAPAGFVPVAVTLNAF